MVNQTCCTPNIFDSNQSSEMTGPNDIALASSFYNARYNEDGKYSQNARATEYDRNAGAVQLYKDGVPYYISGREDKKYNFISYGNKHFKNKSDKKRSSYGHSERVLMRDILDDLIKADVNNHDVRRPSDFSQSEYEVLKELTNKPRPYKEYLERKGLIVKMWSERKACKESPEDGEGGGCSSFIEDIFPAGSQFGYIVDNYSRADNDPPTKIENASEELRTSYLNFMANE